MKWCWIGILLLSSFISRSQNITSFAGCGTCGGIGDGGHAIDAAIIDPNSGTFDKYGNYYFAENVGARIRKVDTLGIITTVAGNGSSGFFGDGGPATAAMLSEPVTVLVDTFGNLYIADANNHRIRKVDISTGIIYTICGNGVDGYSSDGGLADTTEISMPQDICFDKFGNLYIADQVNVRVRKINTTGIISTFAGSGGFSGTGTGDGGPATAATFNFINSLAADDTGNIYIGDFNTGKVRKVDTFGIITTVAGNGGLTYSGDGIPAIDAQMSPARLGFDSSENLYIADKYNRRVYKVDLAGILHNIAGDGMAGYSGDGGPATAASIDFPYGVSFDPCGNLYVPDVNNRRIRKVIFDSIGIPTISISPNPNDTICIGTSVTYTATVISGSAITYQWYIDGGITGATSSTYTYTPSNGDSVRCVLIGISQCSYGIDTVSSNTIYMVVNSITTPTITLTSSASAEIGSTVTVTATVASAGSSYSINWYNNGALFSTTTAPVVTYTKGAGTDNITAIVIPSPIGMLPGCYDSSTSAAFTITVSNNGVNNVAEPRIYVYPNPASTILNINNVTIQEPYSLLSIVGSSLQNGVLQPGNNTISIEGLAPGIYMLEVTSEGGEKTITKIAKQ